VARLDDIEARLAKLEAAIDMRPAIRFAGPFKDDTAYPAGSIVQCRGPCSLRSRTRR
jgi:hypothetical protein